MSWRFRQSFKIIPGLKLNLSKTGLSASIGGAPFTLNVGSRGVSGTASVPGTGISFRQRFSNNSPSHTPVHSDEEPPSIPFAPPSGPINYLPPPVSSDGPLREIRSASTELLTSKNLQELRLLIKTAQEEHGKITSDLSVAKREEGRATGRFESWNKGFLLKWLLKSSFEVRRTEVEIASAKVRELEEQLRLTMIATQVEFGSDQAEPFFKLCDDFTALAECAAIWDVKADRVTDKVRERTAANRTVSRQRVRFSLGGSGIIQWEQQVPHLQNANGGDIFLYPGFILYRTSLAAFSVIDFHDVSLVVKAVRFHEEEGVPGDSKIVGQTWAKTNKDGSPDRRFAGNYQVPIALYGGLILKSETGLCEEFLFSNPERLEQFEKTWATFVRSFEHRVSLVVSQSTSASPENASEPSVLPRLVGTNVHFECGLCRQPIEVNAEASGQEFRCPGCGEKLVVPEILV